MTDAPQTSAFDWLPAELAPVALRLARADELQYQLGWGCLKWSLHALELKQVRRADGLLDVVVANVRPMAPAVSMLFSEVINHLRAAIDNVMFYVVESLRGSSLPEDAAAKVAMPIYQSASKLVDWSNRNKGKVPEFDTSTDLFARIEALQPYNSPAVATAIAAGFEYFAGTLDRKGVHPLLLLQSYSNGDKHRAIRVAAGRTMPHRTNQIPGRYDITMHPVEAGFAVAEGLDDRPGEVDATTAVHVQRPDGQVWVAPGAELKQIHDYVADVVIPTLLTGSGVSPNLPRQVLLDDTGYTDEQRIEAGGSVPAHIRCGRAAMAVADEVLGAAVQVLPPPEGD
jgi:hypothetical protein